MRKGSLKNLTKGSASNSNSLVAIPTNETGGAYGTSLDIINMIEEEEEVKEEDQFSVTADDNNQGDVEQGVINSLGDITAIDSQMLRAKKKKRLRRLHKQHGSRLMKNKSSQSQLAEIEEEDHHHHHHKNQ